MQLLKATHDIFSELKNFLEQIDEERYNRPLDYLSGSTMGQHTRHIVEFFQCLLRQSQRGVVNYDKRERDHLIESQPQAALRAMQQIYSELESVPAGIPIMLETTLSDNEDDFSLIASSFDREWIYALEHAIHHMAILKIGLKIIAPYVQISENFGVGPATVKYRQRQCAQ